ncbi:hypothetical protein HOF92_03675, partial [bacterium]|nr:hypothetical protein [bacterium]
PLDFELEVTDSAGTSTAKVSVKLIPGTTPPVVVVKKEPELAFYRATDAVTLNLSDSYSRIGKFLSFEYEQTGGPEVDSIYLAQSGKHVEALDRAIITLPDFSDELVVFDFQVSVHDHALSTGSPQITTSVQTVSFRAVPLLRKPLIRNVPDLIEVRLTLGEQPVKEIDAGNSRTLDHDGKDLRNPIGYQWSYLPSLFTIPNGEASDASVLKFQVNTNAAEVQNIEDKYISYIDLAVTDESTGQTATKRVVVWIYPAFHTVRISANYQNNGNIADEGNLGAVPNPYFDSFSKTWFYKAESTSALTTTVTINYGFDNYRNEKDPNLPNAHLYGLTDINLYRDAVADGSNPLFDLGVSQGAESAVTATTGSASYALSGVGQYDLRLSASIANGLTNSTTVTLKALEEWGALSASPEITTISIDGQDSATSIVANGAFLELMSDVAVITIDLNGVNPNGGGLNYLGLSSSDNAQVQFVGNSSAGVIRATLDMPIATETVTIDLVLSDALGRSSWNDPVLDVPVSISFDIRKLHTKPQIRIIPETVEVVEQSFIQFRYELIDPDQDLNDVRMLFSIFGSDNPFIEPRHIEGELSVREGTNYIVRWYFSRDGAYFVNSRNDLYLKLESDDHSYQPIVVSPQHGPVVITLDNSLLSTNEGILSVEGFEVAMATIFTESEPNNIMREVPSLTRAKVGDLITLKGKSTNEADTRDSFPIEVEGAVTLSITNETGEDHTRPDIGVFDRESSRLLSYLISSGSGEEILLNPMGGVRRYDVIVYHNQTETDYTLSLDFQGIKFGELARVAEVEPNDTILEDQYLGTLSRSLEYLIDGQGDASDLYSFEGMGDYPLALNLTLKDATS